MALNRLELIVLVLLIIVIILAVIYLIYNSTSSAIASSAYSQAIQAYETELQLCAKSYTCAFQKYISESPQGLTQSELNTLNNLENCMNIASKGIASVAKSANQNPILVLAQDVGDAVIAGVAIAASGFAISLIIKKLRIYTGNALVNGSAAASVIQNAVTQYAVQQGIISAANASGIINTLNNLQQYNTTTLNQFFNQLVAEQIISQDIAQQEIDTINELMAEDLADTEALLV